MLVKKHWMINHKLVQCGKYYRAFTSHQFHNNNLNFAVNGFWPGAGVLSTGFYSR